MIRAAFLSALLVILSFGCARPTPRPQVHVSVIVDFTPFADQGFLFTESRYEGEYSGLGLVTVFAYPELRYEKITKKEGSGIFSEGQEKTSVELVERVNLDELASAVHQEALALGGDCVMNFDLRHEYVETVIGNAVSRTLSHVVATGFVIKRSQPN